MFHYLSPPGHDELVEVVVTGRVGGVAGGGVGVADVDTVQHVLSSGRYCRGCHLSDENRTNW